MNSYYAIEQTQNPKPDVYIYFVQCSDLNKFSNNINIFANKKFGNKSWKLRPLNNVEKQIKSIYECVNLDF